MSELQGYPVRWDKIPEACGLETHHRRVYAGRPHEKPDGAQITFAESDEKELNRDTN